MYRFWATLREGPAPMRGKAERSQGIPDSALQQCTAKDAVWLFVRIPSDLDEDEQTELAAIRQVSPTAHTVYELVQDFMHMLRQREGEHLDDWLRQVRESHIPELQRFVHSIQRDKAAVLAGLTLPHSNGVADRKSEQAEAH